jgi:hypothetical protein
MLSRGIIPLPLVGEGGEKRFGIEPDEGFFPHTLNHSPGGERE